VATIPWALVMIRMYRSAYAEAHDGLEAGAGGSRFRAMSTCL
jgi:hypothetical protein